MAEEPTTECLGCGDQYPSDEIHVCKNIIESFGQAGKEENAKLIELHIKSMSVQDHPLGCVYGGIDEFKTSDDPKDCSCDCGIYMRVALGLGNGEYKSSLEKEHAKFKAALDKYGNHEMSCEEWEPPCKYSSPDCTCGWGEFEQALGKEE